MYSLYLKPIGPIAPNWAPRPILETLVQVDWGPGQWRKLIFIGGGGGAYLQLEGPRGRHRNDFFPLAQSSQMGVGWGGGGYGVI